MFSEPASWPALRLSPRARAQRPLPSMMMARWFGTTAAEDVAASASAGVAVITGAPVGGGDGCCASNLHQLLFLLVAELLDLGDRTVGQLLELFLGSPLLVRRDFFVPLHPLELVRSVAADVPHGDAALHHLDELIAALLGERRDRQADEAAVVGRVDTEV